MLVAAGTLNIKIPYSHSLKEKRAVINSIKRKLVNKFNISVAEVGDLDLRNSAIIGFSAVSSDKNYLMSTVEKVFDFIETNFDIVLTNQDFEILNY